MSWKKTLITLTCVTSCSTLYTTNVTDGNSLENAIIAANISGGGAIAFVNDINLGSTGTPLPDPNLRPLNTNNNFTPNGNIITIVGTNMSGPNFTLDGNGTFRGFFARGGTV